MTTTLLTEDQQALVETTLDFAQDHLAPHALDWDRDRHFPVDVLRKAAGLGLGGVYVREQHGGSALGRADGVLVFEALASGCPAIAGYLSIHNMVAWMIDHYGDDAQRERRLPRLCAMDDLASYCLTEPGAGSDAAALTTRAVPDGDHYVLTGVKQFISGAGAAQVYVVMARTGEPGPRGISAFLVDKDDPGISFGPNERKMGWHAQPTRQVVLDGVRIPADRLL
ncbi:acyl-CoA dehydrogenase family protein, partial [Streptomyces sp. SID6139]|uniref:acyl-CoA dehydrogenase family protein n=1 Tax=Streptomyces sp. SID6139 TaxID=2690320 RepID=UPI00144DA008|nr:acyl-CoA dehydrogenase [Streptomyces sp. SID6139]